MTQALRPLVRKPPARLLLVDDAPEVDLGAAETARAEAFDDPRQGPFDLVVWGPAHDLDPADLGRTLSWTQDRGRRILAAVPRPLVRALVVEASALGLAVAAEQAVDSEAGVPDTVIVDLRPTDRGRGAFAVRSYRPGDEDDILQLFTPSFHVQRTAEHWRWKYLDDPWGRLKITVARSPEGELAAHYAGYPVPFVHADGDWQTLLGLQVGDTMTDPRFRGVGRGPTSLLGRCARHHYAAHCEGQVAFNFGFNTGNIQKFSLRFVRAQRLEPVGYWRAEGIRVEAKALRRYHIERIARLDTGWDRFFRRVAPHYGFLVHRGARYLRWRYLACPDDPPFVILSARRWGRLVGWSVFRRRGDRLSWVDALFHRRHVDAAGALLSAARSHPELAGAGDVVAWFPERPAWWHRALVDLGFQQTYEPNDLAVMFVPHDREDAPELLRGLYYTMGDGDLA
ncbi:MAG: hypothetical protein AAGD06_20555 [Acidobacteriota bacterium]